MDDLTFVLNGLSPVVFFGLVGLSFVASFVTVVMGLGGGILMLAAMASLLPPAALIPVHGVIQLGSNFFRSLLMLRHVHRPPVLAFATGTIAGAALGGSVVVTLPPALVQVGVGLFVIWSVLARPPAFLAKAAWLTGIVSSFLTMFFGATGPFVASYIKSLQLARQGHVATHGVFMTLQHFLKVLMFGFLGFAYGPWVAFVAIMIGAGFLGTLLGQRVLMRMTDARFRQALNLVLVLISVRLIWTGVRAYLA